MRKIKYKNYWDGYSNPKNGEIKATFSAKDLKEPEETLSIMKLPEGQ